MSFRHIRLSFPLKHPNPYDKKRVEMDAIEWIGTGLAIYGAYQEDPYDGYYIAHMASGRRINHEAFSTLVQAGAALKCLLPLTDWTQEESVLLQQQGLLQKVIEVCHYAPVFFPPSCRYKRSV